MAAEAEWRFVKSEEDGAVWLDAPALGWAFIDFREHSRQPWKRLMVVTRAYVDGCLRELERRPSDARSGPWTAFAGMLVVPDGTPAELRASIDDAVRGGGLSMFSRPAESTAG